MRKSWSCKGRIRQLLQLLISMLLVACSSMETATITSKKVSVSMINLVENPFVLDTGLQSRSISFENMTGEPGVGGQASSPLGVGRKGAPARRINPGETVQIADISGAGTIRHIWITTLPNSDVMRGTVIRVYWDGQEYPSIEAPIGDFFGFAHGSTPPFQTAVHSVGAAGSLNMWLPMPFVDGARVTISNEGEEIIPFFFQIDYTIGESYPADIGRLHVLFRRENPTSLGQDFEVLPLRKGRGRYMGTVIGVRPDDSAWWGEGEVKMYIDGDKEFATIVGTGAEDYVGLSWGLQQTPFLYNGASFVEHNDGGKKGTGAISMYRWHMLDPILWSSDMRITMQQIGHKPKDGVPPDTMEKYLGGLFERQDDWSAATFWYEAVPSEPLPKMPNYKERTADL